MSHKMIVTDKAPKAIGPYSQAVRVGNLLFCSGQIPIDPTNNELKLLNGDAAAQTKLVMENLKAVLAAEDFTFNNVVKCTIFISSMDDFAKINEVYASYFTDYKPARATIEVGRLPKNVNVEIDAIAAV